MYSIVHPGCIQVLKQDVIFENMHFLFQTFALKCKKTLQDGCTVLYLNVKIMPILTCQKCAHILKYKVDTAWNVKNKYIWNYM